VKPSEVGHPYGDAVGCRRLEIERAVHDEMNCRRIEPNSEPGFVDERNMSGYRTPRIGCGQLTDDRAAMLFSVDAGIGATPMPVGGSPL